MTVPQVRTLHPLEDGEVTSFSPREIMQWAVGEFAAAGRREGAFSLRLEPVNDDPSSLRWDDDAPDYLRDLASFAGGFEIDELVSWDPASNAQTMPGAIEGWPILDNGQGDSESIDTTPDDEWGTAVFFLCHDPAYLMLQAPNLATWLKDYLDRHLTLSPLAHELDALATDGESRPFLGLGQYHHPLGNRYSDAFEQGRRDRRGADRTLGPAGQITSVDPVLRSFCSTLSPEAIVIDFRDAQPGDHADLDPFGRASNYARAGTLALFAVLPDPVLPFRTYSDQVLHR